MIQERTFTDLKDAHLCGNCEELATHSVTDAEQQADSSWQESAPRYGCANHPVVAVVKLLDGPEIPFDEYLKQHD